MYSLEGGGLGGHDRHSDGIHTVRMVQSRAGDTSRDRAGTNTRPGWRNFWTGRCVFPSLGRAGILLDPQRWGKTAVSLESRVSRVCGPE